MTKKDILMEVATSLYLLMTFSKPTPSLPWDEIDEKILENTQKKAEAALRMAEPVIGIMNMRTVQDFLETREDNFTISCGVEMVKGDKVRFEENVFDNRNRSCRYLGQRIIYAEIRDIHQEGRDCLFTMRIISTQGVWPLYAGTEIRRLARNTRQARRIPWPDENKRPIPFISANQQRKEASLTAQ